ncbi:hypothetical protein BHE74_00002467, partial [Ensete ventricosum]
LIKSVLLQVDLVGGYYDAGDHVKFGLPMAFTVTMLSWSVAEYGHAIASAGELEHALEAIKWGTDYFIKAHTHHDVLWAEVGDGDTDHYCWQRPEDMTTSRKAYKIDPDRPGSEVAGETAAAMAAASLVFRETNPHYSHLLLHHAQQVATSTTSIRTSHRLPCTITFLKMTIICLGMQLFAFGDKYRGKYDTSIPAVKSYYPSLSGYGDELLWAALWLHRATGREDYLRYAIDNAHELGGTGWDVSEFSWDIKYAGVQILASKVKLFLLLLLTYVAFDNIMDDKDEMICRLTNGFFCQLLMEGGRRHLQDEQIRILEQYRSRGQHYVCSCLGLNTNGSNVRRTPGGLLIVRQWNNMQYVASASFLLTVFADHLAMSSGEPELHCPRGSLSPADMLSFVKTQVDYILGSNPLRLSYLVGFGPKYPTRVHHRAASTVSYKVDKSFIGCAQGYDKWFGRRRKNPNDLVGALVGGPDAKDEFRDVRRNYMQTEACTYNTAPMVGVFARFYRPIHK